MSGAKDNYKEVCFNHEAVYVGGRPTIILCSSLFYFRIPAGCWRDRMRKVAQAGYNCIDVYFPWNYHEMREGEWDFSGEKDVGAFLGMAAEEGLWVIARPGPYICSEWDGGGLPAYLFTKADMKIRDNDSLFLRYVDGWYSRILPIIRDYQIDCGGSVIAVQLDNELDFYDCKDRKGYISALRDMARSYGIRVPLFVCAGQGDIIGAGGDVDGVMPTVNLYTGKGDYEFEAKALHFRDVLKSFGVPLCVTETNKRHFWLRRLLSCGAKLIGPYNQVAGTDFGFTTSVNNWGDPMSFMTSDYGLESMVSSMGEKNAEYFEGKILGGFIRTMGEALAKSVPVKESGISLRMEFPTSADAPCVLALHGGGFLVFIPNLGDEDGEAWLETGGMKIPGNGSVKVRSGTCPVVMVDIPLKTWGLQGRISYSTAELLEAKEMNDGAAMIFCSDGESETAFLFDRGARIEDISADPGARNSVAVGGAGVLREPGAQSTSAYYEDMVLLRFDGLNRLEAKIRLADGKLLNVHIIGRYEVVRLNGLNATGGIEVENPANEGKEERSVYVCPDVGWSYCGIIDDDLYLADKRQFLGNEPRNLEKVGIYRGYGWYGSNRETNADEECMGLMVHEAGDIVSAYCNGQYLGTFCPGGGNIFIPFKKPFSGGKMKIQVRTEIWGHSNFDDSRLPALRLKSLRGLRGITAVTRICNLDGNWKYRPGSRKDIENCIPEIDDSMWAVVGWSGWNSTDRPVSGFYRKDFNASSDADSWLLGFEDFNAFGELYINGNYAGEINKFSPVVDISGHVAAGNKTTIVVFVEKRFHSEVCGKVIMYEGKRTREWWVAGAEESELWSRAIELGPLAEKASFPLKLNAGRLGWLFGNIAVKMGSVPSMSLTLCGSNAKATVFFNGHVVGRIWLPSESRPVFKGGRGDFAYLPSAWFMRGDNEVAILLEAVEKEKDAEICGLILKKVAQHSE